MLHLANLRAGYAGGTVLHDLSLHVAAGSIHAVIGANGAGKTTLIHTISGLHQPTGGRIELDGRDITGTPAHHRARAGIALVPQGRRVFASLTVAEHLTLARRPDRHHRAGRVGWDQRRVLDLLPQLAGRLRHRGRQLSGGEQQMLAIARALVTQPRLLLLDEPTEGLAPTLAVQVRDLITRLAFDGLAVLLTTPEVDQAAIADHTTTLATGRTTTVDRNAQAPRKPAAPILAMAAGNHHDPSSRPQRPVWRELLVCQGVEPVIDRPRHEPGA